MNPPVDREDCYSVTHPSDHNSIFIDSPVNKQRRKARKHTLQRRRDRDGQKLEGSKGKSKGGNDGLEARYTRGQGHAVAFMIAVPLISGYGYPYVYPSCPWSCAAVGLCWLMRSVYLRVGVDNFRVYPDAPEAMVHCPAAQWMV